MIDTLEQFGSKHKAFYDCPDFLVSYLRYAAVFLNLGHDTVYSVFLTLREFLQFIHYKNKVFALPSTADAHKDMSIAQMSLQEAVQAASQEIEEYLYFLDTVANNSQSTVYKKVCAIRPFYQYLVDHQEELGIQLNKNPMDSVRVQKAQKQKARTIPQADIRRLLDNVSGSSHVRDYAIILLILTTGLSLKHVTSLDVDDYDGSVLMAGSPEKRSIPLTKNCIYALDCYLKEYREPLEETLVDKDALFVGASLRRLSPRRMQQIMKKHLVAAGLDAKGYTLNDLKDTAVVAILNNATPAERPFILEYLGYQGKSAYSRFSDAVTGKVFPTRSARNVLLSSQITEFGNSAGKDAIWKS